jgi:hypothetical protein
MQLHVCKYANTVGANTIILNHSRRRRFASGTSCKHSNTTIHCTTKTLHYYWYYRSTVCATPLGRALVVVDIDRWLINAIDCLCADVGIDISRQLLLSRQLLQLLLHLLLLLQKHLR